MKTHVYRFCVFMVLLALGLGKSVRFVGRWDAKTLASSNGPAAAPSPKLEASGQFSFQKAANPSTKGTTARQTTVSRTTKTVTTTSAKPQSVPIAKFSGTGSQPSPNFIPSGGKHVKSIPGVSRNTNVMNRTPPPNTGPYINTFRTVRPPVSQSRTPGRNVGGSAGQMGRTPPPNTRPYIGKRRPVRPPPAAGSSVGTSMGRSAPAGVISIGSNINKGAKLHGFTEISTKVSSKSSSSMSSKQKGGVANIGTSEFINIPYGPVANSGVPSVSNTLDSIGHGGHGNVARVSINTNTALHNAHGPALPGHNSNPPKGVPGSSTVITSNINSSKRIAMKGKSKSRSITHIKTIQRTVSRTAGGSGTAILSRSSTQFASNAGSNALGGSFAAVPKSKGQVSSSSTIKRISASSIGKVPVSGAHVQNAHKKTDTTSKTTSNNLSISSRFGKKESTSSTNAGSVRRGGSFTASASEIQIKGNDIRFINSGKKGFAISSGKSITGSGGNTVALVTNAGSDGTNTVNTGAFLDYSGSGSTSAVVGSRSGGFQKSSTVSAKSAKTIAGVAGGQKGTTASKHVSGRNSRLSKRVHLNVPSGSTGLQSDATVGRINIKQENGVGPGSTTHGTNAAQGGNVKAGAATGTRTASVTAGVSDVKRVSLKQRSKSAKPTASVGKAVGVVKSGASGVTNSGVRTNILPAAGTFSKALNRKAGPSDSTNKHATLKTNKPVVPGSAGQKAVFIGKGKASVLSTTSTKAASANIGGRGSKLAVKFNRGKKPIQRGDIPQQTLTGTSNLNQASKGASYVKTTRPKASIASSKPAGVNSKNYTSSQQLSNKLPATFSGIQSSGSSSLSNSKNVFSIAKPRPVGGKATVPDTSSSNAAAAKSNSRSPSKKVSEKASSTSSGAKIPATSSVAANVKPKKGTKISAKVGVAKSSSLSSSTKKTAISSPSVGPGSTVGKSKTASKSSNIKTSGGVSGSPVVATGHKTKMATKPAPISKKNQPSASVAPKAPSSNIAEQKAGGYYYLDANGNYQYYPGPVVQAGYDYYYNPVPDIAFVAPVDDPQPSPPSPIWAEVSRPKSKKEDEDT